MVEEELMGNNGGSERLVKIHLSAISPSTDGPFHINFSNCNIPHNEDVCAARAPTETAMSKSDYKISTNSSSSACSTQQHTQQQFGDKIKTVGFKLDKQCQTLYTDCKHTSTTSQTSTVTEDDEMTSPCTSLRCCDGQNYYQKEIVACNNNSLKCTDCFDGANGDFMFIDCNGEEEEETNTDRTQDELQRGFTQYLFWITQ